MDGDLAIKAKIQDELDAGQYLPVQPGLIQGAALPAVPGLAALPTVNSLRGLQAGMVRPPMPATRPVNAAAMAASTSKAPGTVPAKAGQPALPPAVLPSSVQPCTVYVGRISTEVSDDFVRQLLDKCGKVSKWNRAADPNTSKLTSFGFCDFEEPQGVWRALEFLHEKQLCDKKLLVKCEEKAKQTIDTWKAAVEKEIEKLLVVKNKDFPEVKDGEDQKTKEEDEKAAKEALEKEKKEKEAAAEKKDEKDNKDKEKERTKTEERGKSEADRKRKRDEEREEREKAVSRHYRASRRERDRDARVRDRERDIEKEYSYRLREFERSEDKRIRNLKQDLRDLEPASEPSEREKRKFGERDLDFRESDVKEWKRRREDREKDRKREQEKDAADTVAEKEEEEESKRKKKEDEERKKKEKQEAEEKAKREAEEAERKRKEEEKKKKEEAEKKEREEREAKEKEEKEAREKEQKKQQQDAAAKLLQSVQAEIMSAPAPAPKAAPPAHVQALFKEPEDLDANGQPRKHKPLTRLDGPPAEDRKLRDDEMRRLIQQVPTDKARAFAFDIDWDAVHGNNIIEKKLRPWVKKKVTEFLGNEEQGMIEFILKKVSARTKPDTILAELEGFLDEEAENFTLKMWRMLIFEVLRVKAR
ncbi:RBM25 [Symbiodinium natans]|uniref:RBM25 protein n=1 Tax=Symbiodinium natans TaxID=878477 RepID=A0A812P7V0_9DINO|nr:RBM25 [Symbiodinium natans]